MNTAYEHLHKPLSQITVLKIMIKAHPPAYEKVFSLISNQERLQGF